MAKASVDTALSCVAVAAGTVVGSIVHCSEASKSASVSEAPAENIRSDTEACAGAALAEDRFAEEGTDIAVLA